MPVLPRLSLIAIATILIVSGCSKASDSKPSPSATRPSAAAQSPTVGTSASVPTVAPSTSAPATASFNGSCSDLLPVSLVNDALGRPVIGNTAYVVGVAEPNIGRLAYLNCRYGIPAAVAGKPAPTPQLEIGASIYDSDAQAARRLAGTVEDYLSRGAVQTKTTAGTYQAIILVGYHDPTVVAIAGPRTVAITVRQTLFVGDRAAALTALAKAVLDATANSTEPSSAVSSGSVPSVPPISVPSGPALSGSPAAS